MTGQSPGRESRASASASASGAGRATPSRRATPLRAARKRTLLDETETRSLNDFSVTGSAKGDLEVAEACPDGSFVKIRNKGKKVRSFTLLGFYDDILLFFLLEYTHPCTVLFHETRGVINFF